MTFRKRRKPTYAERYPERAARAAAAEEQAKTYYETRRVAVAGLVELSYSEAHKKGLRVDDRSLICSMQDAETGEPRGHFFRTPFGFYEMGGIGGTVWVRPELFPETKK